MDPAGIAVTECPADAASCVQRSRWNPAREQRSSFTRVGWVWEARDPGGR